MLDHDKEVAEDKPLEKTIEDDITVEAITDHGAKKKLLRKLDRHIIPIVMLLYLFSFVDRINIRNARLYGLEDDLKLKGHQYQTTVSLLFVTYILSELPSNLVLKKFKPSRWISFIATSWGVIATLTGIVQSYGGLIVCRLLLGMFEGGLFPGFMLYLTLFYTKGEIALRIGYLFVSAALAGAFGGLLAYGIGFMDGVAGQRGWRWIMIIEGLPAFVLGILAWFLLADDPEHAIYLSGKEKQLIATRMSRQTGGTRSAQKLHRKDVYLALRDWKIWAFCTAQFGVDIMLYGYSTFLPTIINKLDRWTTAQTQALTIPCYFLGALTYLVVCQFSDHQQRRGLYTVLSGIISVIGDGVIRCRGDIAGMAFFQPAPLWEEGYMTIGNSAGAAAPFLYKTTDSPRYVKGNAVTLGMVAFATSIFAFMSWILAQKNKRRLQGDEDARIAGMTDDQIEELGDASPRYMYTT